MMLLPAIDLSEGKCVRLRQGKKGEKTIYSHDPASVARRWEQEGAHVIHVVDLDRTIDGISHNMHVIADIARSVSVPVELGGGLRDTSSVQEAFQIGVRRVVIGTKALTDREFLDTLIERFGPEKIMVGIDARDGYVAIKGWTEITTQTAVEFALRISKAGATRIVYTDIARDGMLTGLNMQSLQEMLEKTELNIIASGGVASINDVKVLLDLHHPRLEGVIIGKALYEGQIDLKEAVALVTH